MNAHPGFEITGRRLGGSYGERSNRSFRLPDEGPPDRSDSDAFAVAFCELVLPRLTARIEIEAFFVAHGSADFADAIACTMGEAVMLGASCLSDPQFFRLEDWISTKLLSAILRAERRVAGLRAELAADPAGFFARAAPLVSPLARWIFAAVCPEFRRRLIEERRHAG